MEELLTATGLSITQAAVYLYLLRSGKSTPPVIASSLRLTRTNAYKVLDTLVEIGLIHKSEINKKFVYRAEDPISLTNLVAQERTRVIALEQSVREAMHELRAVYQRSHNEHEIRTFRGAQAIKSLYIHQAKRPGPIYFIESEANVTVMGLTSMTALRQLPTKHGINSYGISSGTIGASDKLAGGDTVQTNRTWVDANAYVSPVEWSVSGDEMMIVDFSEEPSAIRIQNKVISESFVELWKLLDQTIQRTTGYEQVPPQAKQSESGPHTSAHTPKA